MLVAGSCTPKERALTLVIAGLGAGGAERVMGLLAKAWSHQPQVRVTLITLDGRPPFYTLGDRVDLVQLDLASPSGTPWQALYKNLLRLGQLRRAIRASRPDVVISFIDEINVLCLLATLGTGIRCIVSERVDPHLHRVRAPWGWLRRHTYPLADALVVQTPGIADWFASWLPQDKIKVIANPVELSEPGADSAAPFPFPYLLGIGRLVRAKGFDLLIQAFAELAGQHPTWHLVIVGEGEERANLLELAHALGVGKKVVFPGLVTDIRRYLRGCGVFVLSSREEGMPNVLLEAMAEGCACVAADCCSGVSTLVKHRATGLLVPPERVDAVREALATLMSDPDQCRDLGKHAREGARPYALPSILAQWEALLAQTLKDP